MTIIHDSPCPSLFLSLWGNHIFSSFILVAQIWRWCGIHRKFLILFVVLWWVVFDVVLQCTSREAIDSNFGGNDVCFYLSMSHACMHVPAFQHVILTLLRLGYPGYQKLYKCLHVSLRQKQFHWRHTSGRDRRQHLQIPHGQICRRKVSKLLMV